MSKEKPKNVAASVRAKLADIARKKGDEFQLVLSRYAVERFLYRLTVSGHGENFVLKGAMLFQLWADEPHRATRDVDLLGSGDNSVERLADVARAACTVGVPDDGLAFDPKTVAAARIKEDQEYEGVRITCVVRLGQARIALQVDVGFGDAITPGPVRVEYPTILEFPAPVLKAYPRETVVAEKFQAMTALGIANSRMKDFSICGCWPVISRSTERYSLKRWLPHSPAAAHRCRKSHRSHSPKSSERTPRRCGNGRRSSGRESSKLMPSRLRTCAVFWTAS